MSKVSKITLFMLVDLTNEFLKYVLYLQTFLPGLLPHCNLTYMTSEKNYLTSSISFDMSYLKITFQTQFSGTSNTLTYINFSTNFHPARLICYVHLLGTPEYIHKQILKNPSLGFLPGIRRIKWIMTECCISAFSSLLLSHEKILKNDHFLSYHTCLFQESRKKRDRGPFSNCFRVIHCFLARKEHSTVKIQFCTLDNILKPQLPSCIDAFNIRKKL